VIERDPSQYSWWLASRAAGIVAFVLIACSVILGLYMASGLAGRPGLKRTLVKVHEQLALTALAAIAAHGLLLLGDKWLKPGITGIAIPFTMPYRPAFTGLGIVAGYLAAVLGPTYYMRRRIGTRRWRFVHRATVIVYALGLVHALGGGTDGATVWFRTLALFTAMPIVVLLVARYAGPRRRPAAPVRRSAPPPGGRSSAPSHG
jgi:sulfoxide reductase heme-binding subunit YedZ